MTLNSSSQRAQYRGRPNQPIDYKAIYNRQKRVGKPYIPLQGCYLPNAQVNLIRQPWRGNAHQQLRNLEQVALYEMTNTIADTNRCAQEIIAQNQVAQFRGGLPHHFGVDQLLANAQSDGNRVIAFLQQRTAEVNSL